MSSLRHDHTDPARTGHANAGQPEGDLDADADGEHRATVISLPTRRTAIPEDTRPIPSVAVYDQLLSRTPKGTA
jgi:hypothetical protein